MSGTSAPEPPAPGGDPWAAFGYVVAGVLFYGMLGWGVAALTHADYWIAIGIVIGAGFGMYLVFSQYMVRESGSTDTKPRRKTEIPDNSSHTNSDDAHPHDTATAPPDDPPA
jgi:hypothetical protein